MVIALTSLRLEDLRAEPPTPARVERPPHPERVLRRSSPARSQRAPTPEQVQRRSGPARSQRAPEERRPNRPSGRRPPDSPRRSPRAYEHWLRARLALDGGRSPEAVEELRLALVYDEAGLPLELALAEAHLEQGRLGRARALIEDLRRRWPRHPGPRRLGIRLADLSNKPLRGLREARSAARLGRTWADFQRLAERLEAAGRKDEALEVLSRAERALPGRKEPPRAIGEMLFQLHPVEARRAFERAAAVAWDPREDLVRLVELDHRLGDDRLATQRLNAARLVWPADPVLVRAAIRAALWVSDLVSASEVASEGLRLRAILPGDVALLFAEEGVFAGPAAVEQSFARAFRALPPRIQAERLLALRRKKAALRRLAAVRPDDLEGVKARLLLAELLEDEGRPEAAERALSSALDGQPEGVERDALARRPIQALEDALAELRARQEGSPEAEVGASCSTTWEMEGSQESLAPLVRLMGRIEAGETQPSDLERVRLERTRAPDDPRLLAALGRLYGLRGDLEGARDALERAARLRPRDATVWRWLSEARAALGDREGARAASQTALRREAADRRARRARRPSRGLERPRGDAALGEGCVGVRAPP